MAQQFRGLAALAGAPGLVPSIHMVARGPDALFGTSQAPSRHVVHVETCRQRLNTHKSLKSHLDQDPNADDIEFEPFYHLTNIY